MHIFCSVDEQVSLAMDKLVVLFGCKILKIIPGRVSTEVDARYFFSLGSVVGQSIWYCVCTTLIVFILI